MEKLNIRPVGLDHIQEIQDLAWKIWPGVFKDILSPEQINYMMEMMYSPHALLNQIGVLGHQFLIFDFDQKPVGYISYEIHYKGLSKTKIHKLYLSEETRGKGLGSRILEEITSLAIQKNDTALVLNVNRNNPAIKFYEKNGFHLDYEEIIDIGKGYIMDDYVMVKQLVNS